MIFLVFMLLFLLVPFQKVFAYQVYGPQVEAGKTNDISFSNIRVVNESNHFDIWSGDISVMWNLDQPSLMDRVTYRISRYTSSRGDLWENTEVLDIRKNFYDGPAVAYEATLCLTAAKIDWTYTIIGAKSRQRLEELASRDYIRNQSEGCRNLWIEKWPNAVLEYSNNIVSFHDLRDNGLIVGDRRDFYVYYQIESFYNPGIFDSTKTGPTISVLLYTGPNANAPTEVDLITNIQNRYNRIIIDYKSMFDKIPDPDDSPQLWGTEPPSWIENAINLTLRKILLANKSGISKGVLDAFVPDDLTRVYPTAAGWDKLDGLTASATSILKSLKDLETLKAENDRLATEFDKKIMKSGESEGKTSSLAEMKTDITSKIQIVREEIGAAPGVNNDVSGTCMDEKGLKAEGEEINILGFIACLINKVADQILQLAVSWMATFAGI